MFFIILGIFAGACFILNKSINMLLSNETGIFSSNFINHLTGLLGSFIIYIIVISFSEVKVANITNLPFYAFLGGTFGATFIILSNYSFSKTSVITSSILILSGQFLSSLLFDYLVLNNGIKITKVIGAILIIIAIILYSSEKND